MPRKGKGGAAKKESSRAAPPSGPQVSDDDSVFNDDIQSNFSEESGNSLFKDEQTLSDDSDAFEEKLSEVLEMASGKSAKERTKALDGLCKALGKKYLPWFVEDRRLTIADTIERCLKRGKMEEQVAAAHLVGVYAAQIGTMDDNEEVTNQLKAILTTVMLDPTADPRTRSASASALGLICFLLSAVEEFDEVMDDMEKVFTSPSLPTALQSAAVSSWTLLLSLFPPRKCFRILERNIGCLLELLMSSDVDLRISVGEALVVLYEIIGDAEDLEDEVDEVMKEAIDTMTELAKDSNKYRSKKEKKEQKSSFRDMVRYIEGEELFYEKHSFSQNQVLEIETWAHKKQYDALRKNLGSGINPHLTTNPLLREMFYLGPVKLEFDKEELKNAKKQHIKVSKQNNMLKDLARGKNRDKKRAGLY